MKYSVMTLLCFIFSLLGCEGKQDNIAVTNSYVFHVGAEIMPYSKLIKQQKIKNSNSRTAEFDQNGYVTSYQLAGLQVTIDYQAAKYFYTHNSKEFVYNLILDNDKNILAIKNDESQDIAIATYDNKGRIIKTEVTNLGEDNLKFINHISYENDLVNETTFEILITFDKQTFFPVLLKQRQYFYNNKNQLIKSIDRSFRPVEDGYIVDSDKQKVPEKEEECTYSDHNQYGDWTRLYCLTPEKQTTRFELRELEYY